MLASMLADFTVADCDTGRTYGSPGKSLTDFHHIGAKTTKITSGRYGLALLQQTLQPQFVLDRDARSLDLQQIVFLKVGKEPRHRFPRRSDHLGNLFMGKRKVELDNT